ncbi:hypothetical protein LOK49_LG08G02811 [Camellia lanceoleosa]|uniref:Uncharacterized protein n=1 Tax=Camellia lanceoleosa TaxID=1840588 RepID=A0ACC0GQC9_9ERIC|nr:hypothetical protein LOK49_LG08G02811 [Camellia lanceoleosa]
MSFTMELRAFASHLKFWCFSLLLLVDWKCPRQMRNEGVAICCSLCLNQDICWLHIEVDSKVLVDFLNDTFRSPWFLIYDMVLMQLHQLLSGSG